MFTKDQVMNVYHSMVKTTDYILKTKDVVINFIKGQLNMPNMLPATIRLII